MILGTRRIARVAFRRCAPGLGLLPGFHPGPVNDDHHMHNSAECAEAMEMIARERGMNGSDLLWIIHETSGVVERQSDKKLRQAYCYFSRFVLS